MWLSALPSSRSSGPKSRSESLSLRVLNSRQTKHGSNALVVRGACATCPLAPTQRRSWGQHSIERGVAMHLTC